MFSSFLLILMHVLIMRNSRSLKELFKESLLTQQLTFVP